MDSIPIWIILIATIIVLVSSIELGYRLGNSIRLLSKNEKETSVSTTVGAILGMLAFFLVFTFGAVYQRYESKKDLVRQEANSIRTSFLRSDFLPEKEQHEARSYLIKYVDLRLEAVRTRDMEKVKKAINESVRIQNQLWNMAAVNARKDMNSPVFALYIESLNDMINLNAMRVAVGLQVRIPNGIWLIIYILIILTMFSIGYQTAVTGSSRRTWVMTIMVLAFSLMIFLIASLDRPEAGFITVTQQPLIDLRTWMNIN
ncbi:MAG: hypothetical protein ACM34M_07410 [Ignavibacteria bacterium]